MSPLSKIIGIIQQKNNFRTQKSKNKNIRKINNTKLQNRNFKNIPKHPIYWNSTPVENVYSCLEIERHFLFLW